MPLPDYDSLVANFKEQFESFNASKLGGKALSPKEWERVLNYINGKSIFESAKFLRDKFVLERDDGTKPYLKFLDEDYTKNRYQVTHQITVVGKYTNRYDVTLLINGLPLVQIELKRRGIDIKEAVNQIMRYRKDFLTAITLRCKSNRYVVFWFSHNFDLLHLHCSKEISV